jgi:predicted permease
MSYQVQREAIFDDSGGHPEKIYAQWVSGDAFPILGIKPALGRLFTAADDQKPGQHPVAVLSYDFWSRRFGRNPAVLGRWLTLREKQLQIIGVAEQGFTGVEPGVMTDVWAPNMMWDATAITDSGWSWFRIWGRLGPGVTPDQERAIIQAVFTNFRRERAAGFRPDEPRESIDRYINTPVYLRSASNGTSDIRSSFARPLWILAMVAFLVLLIACSNVASLLVARAAARDREMALRLSIGAGRGRLVQQVLIESAMLSLASCLLGWLLAVEAAPMMVGMLSTSQTIVRLTLTLDWRVFAFVAAAGLLTTLLFGLAPAFRASAVSPNAALKSGPVRQSAKIGLFRPLVALQTAFSFVVLFVAGLLLASFSKLDRSDPGFDKNHLVVVDVEAKELRSGGQKSLAAWRQLVDRLRETPGIESASLSGWSIFTGAGQSLRVRVPGRAVDASEPYYLPVSPHFFETMRIRLLAGRDFGAQDAEGESSTAVIVNEGFARRYFPGERVLGLRFFSVYGNGKLIPQEVVGIARDAKYNSLRETPPPTVYYPARPANWAAVQVRTSLEPTALGAVLRRELPRVHPAFRITDITLQSTLVDNTIGRERLLALLSAFFSIVAVVLVAVGLYGVLSYSVVQRTREIGIRLALGARPVRVLALVASEAGLMTVLGLGVGLATGMAAARFVRTLLYEVEPSDWSSIASPVVCLLLVGVLSALPPALRATRIDPIRALRYE